MDIFDIWVNLVTEQSAQQFVTQEGYENIPGYLGSNQGPVGVDSLLAIMDELGVATGVFTGGLDRNTAKLLEICSAHPGRFMVAGGVGDPSRPGRQVKRLRELAQHPAFCMVRVMPLGSQVPTNDARHYPIYQVCEKLGIPVGINAGIPGPRGRWRCCSADPPAGSSTGRIVSPTPVGAGRIRTAANCSQVAAARGRKPGGAIDRPRCGLERSATGLVSGPLAGRAHPLVGRHHVD